MGIVHDGASSDCTLTVGFFVLTPEVTLNWEIVNMTFFELRIWEWQAVSLGSLCWYDTIFILPSLSEVQNSSGINACA